MDIKSKSAADLLYDLQRQYRSGVATMGPCPVCGKESVGANFCKTCLTAELGRRGATFGEIADLRHLLRHRRALNIEISEAIEKIQEAVK